MSFEGSCNSDLCERWLEVSLLPQLVPDDVIVLDDSSFHSQLPLSLRGVSRLYLADG